MERQYRAVVNAMIEERRYQSEGIAALFDYFSRETGNPVIAWPTGTGKSIIPAKFIQIVLGMWPTQRFMVLTHVKELIRQNSERMIELWPLAPVGVYSAGLHSRDVAQPIIFGGIASCVKRPEMFGHRDIVFIDEVHLFSPDEDSMYQTFIAALKQRNPKLKVIGMSATPYRIGQGYITDGGLFTHIVHNLTTLEEFNRLIAEGYLCPVVPRKTKSELDVSNVGMNRGEFAQKQLQEAVDHDSITRTALAETCELGQNRRSWLLFASGVEHSEHIASILTSYGVRCEAVHSKIPHSERDRRIADFKAGRLRAVSTNNVLTTGFDHAPIDLIGMLRPTMSTALWVQMLGRGTRPSVSTGKTNCLVLDFAKNTLRLGPINDPFIPRKKGEKPGDMPVKICGFCGTYNHTRASHCIGCGEEFEITIKIAETASTQPLLRSDMPEVHYFDVQRVLYNIYRKEGKPDSIKVSYVCGLHMYHEWIAFEAHGYASKRARDWWRVRHWSEPPLTTAQALERIGECRTPKRIRVWVNKRYPEILGCEF